MSRSLGSGKPPVLPRPPHTHGSPLLRAAVVCRGIWVSGRRTSFAAPGSLHHVCVHLCHMAIMPVYPLGTRSSEARPTLGARRRPTEKMWNASRFCVSSLRRGHANLLCIVPILVYVLPKQYIYLLKILPIYSELGIGKCPNIC